MAPPKGLLILTTQRSTGTALMRIFQQLEEQSLLSIPENQSLEFMLEPLVQVYFETNCLDSTINKQTSLPDSYQEAYEYLLNKITQGSILFIKEQAVQFLPLIQYMESKNISLAGFLAHFNILFLLRHPLKTIPSSFAPHVKAKAQATFSDSSVGYIDLLTLFKKIADATQNKPLIIESEAYLKSPVEVLAPYFKSFDYPFDKSMLSWRALSDEAIAANPYYALWGDAWYDTVRHSTGLHQRNSPNEGTYMDTPENNEILKYYYLKHLPAYEAIKALNRPQRM